jgi:hypothetical protein
MNQLFYIRMEVERSILNMTKMKNRIRAMIMVTGILAITLQSASAQIGDIGTILSGGVEDAELILGEYLRPLANSLGANLNGGWYNTAKVHGTLGFDVTFTVSTAFAPDEAKIYDIANLAGLTGIPSTPTAPTVTGETGSGPDIQYSLQDPTGTVTLPFSYEHPAGTGVSLLPSPMVNAGIGLPKGFEIMGRFMPRMKIQGTEFGLWGVGVKHDIGQWIPFVKRVPVLHFTLMYGYTNVGLDAQLNGIDPGDIDVADNTTSIDWDDQNFDMKTQGHTANFLVGANLPIVAFYGGIGVSVTQTNLKLNGYYPIPVVNVNTGQLEVTDASAELGKDPIDIEIKNRDGGTTKPRFNVGMRLKFAVVTIHFDYTYANYSVATAGLGFSFR